jgi:hypothetical protein
MSRLIIAAAGVGVGVAVALWYVGGFKAVGCGVLTAIVAAAVITYAFVPITNGSPLKLAAGDIVTGLPGGMLIPFAVSAIPAGAWYVVSMVHPRRTRLGLGYAVLYCGLVACCSVASGIVAAGACFPRQARWVLGKASEWLPEDG